jgi:hypothetical protein
VKRWIVILGIAVAGWMTGVLYSRSLFLMIVSNYPGVLAARWVQYRALLRPSA